MRKLIAFLTALCLMSIFTSSDGYALLIKQTTEDLTLKSEHILTGEVIAIKSEWNDEKTTINTYVTVRVQQDIKGISDKNEVVIRVPGGTVDDVTLRVSDVPEFRLNEKVLVFLGSDEQPFFYVKGWFQGKYTIANHKIIEKDIRVKNFISQIHNIMRENGLEKQIVPLKSEEELPPTLKKVPLHMQNEELGKKLSEIVKKKALKKGKISDRMLESAPLAPAAGWTTIMTESFEGSFPSANWYVFDGLNYPGEYKWGKDDYKPYGGTYSAWCARDGADGLDPESNNYPNYCESWAVYGPFDLSDANQADVSLQFWLQSEPNFDILGFLVSIDGLNFYGPGGSGDFGGWAPSTWDLTNFPTLGDVTGQPSVWIAIIFISDGSVTYKGAFIDNVVLRKYVPPPPPVISNISPDTGSANTGTTVTISGSNFGSQDGSSEVHFYAKPGFYASADILSWNDTSIQCTVPWGASSGDVNVLTSAGTSNGFPFTVTFGYGGCKWYDDDIPVPYYINESGTPDCTGEFAAIQTAYQTWQDVSDAYMRFTYEGTTTLTGHAIDGSNVMSWGALDPGAVAANYTTSSVAGDRISDSDIVFNSSLTWSDSGEPGKWDVQTVATHEIGHSLNLRDLYGSADSEKTMFWGGSPGETKARTLEPEDILGIQYIYPGDPPNNPPVLSGGSVAPPSGAIATNFTYSVTYTDDDNDPPTSITVSIDGGPAQAMSKQNPGDSNYTDGCIYQYQASGLFKGGHNYQFAASDGTDAATGDTGSYSGPTINNTAPVLDPIGPQSVNEGEALNFTVSGSDADGDSLSYSASNLPPGATFEPFGGDFEQCAFLEGAGGYLSIPDHPDWDVLNNTDYTVDLWVRHNSLDGFQSYVTQQEDTLNNWTFFHHIGQGVYFNVEQGGTAIVALGYNYEITDNEWHHIALCKVSNEYGIYVDGDQKSYVSDASTDTFAGPLEIGRQGGAPGYYFDGYMDDVRITHSNPFGAAPSGALTDAISVPVFPHASDVNTKLLLHCDGPAGSTAFTDDGNTGHAVTANGDVQIQERPVGSSVIAALSTAAYNFSWTPDYTQGDIIYNDVHFEVTDGTDTDSEDVDITVWNVNLPPLASSLSLSPPSPLTDDNLVGSYTYSDPDANPETGSQIRWYKNAVLQPAYNDLLTVPSSATQKGEEWYFTVRPNDGTDFGSLVSLLDWDGPVTIQNTPPAVMSIGTIAPPGPHTNDDLVGSYSYSDEDGDPESGSEIRWYKNAVLQPAYNDTLTIPSSATTKNDNWYYTVRPNDGTDFGSLQSSIAVVIHNTPPTASDLAITPSSPSTEDDLVAAYTYFDLDGDIEDGTEVRWYKDTVLQPAYNDTLTIPSSATQKGEEWYFTVTPNDGTDFGGLQTSATVTIQNTPPVVPTLGSINPPVPYTDDDLVGSYLYTDADGDPESGSEIRWYKNAVLQPAYNDLLTVPSSATTKNDTWSFTVKPSDGTDLGSLRNSSSKVIENMPPVASDLLIAPSSPSTEDDLVAAYTYFDLDGDIEDGTEVRWYKDAVLQPAYVGLTVPSSATQEGEEWHFTVKPHDGDVFGDLQTSSAVTIQNYNPLVTADLDSNGQDEVIIDFGPAYGIWIRYNNSTWDKLSDLSPEFIVGCNIDGDAEGKEDLIIDFGDYAGIWIWCNDATWDKLQSLSAERMVTGDINNDGKDEIIIDFGQLHGIWTYYPQTDTWSKLQSLSCYSIASADIDGNGQDDLIIDFDEPYGIWIWYNDSAWEKLHYLNSKCIIAADIDNDLRDEVIVDFGQPHGIWVYYKFTNSWSKLHYLNCESMTAGELEGNYLDDLIIDFGDVDSWVWYNDTTWERLHYINPEWVITGDMDNTGQDEVIIDFGDSYGIWIKYNDSTWMQLHDLSP